MRRVILVIVTLVWGLSIAAQEVGPTSTLLFERVEWDFGRIEESAGKVSHTFTYTNTSDHPISIERVYSSCGCTTGNYSRRPLKTGEKGEFTVTFDPEDNPGRFDKRITLVYDSGNGRTELRIKGVVKARKRSTEVIYPQALGAGVRADATYKAFGNVAQGGSRSMTIALVNTSDKGVKLEPEWEENSGMLELFLPDTLAPGEVALATATYLLPSESTRYGLLRDKVWVVIDGTRSKEQIVCTAIGVDNFDKNATAKPQAVVSPSWHDFGEVKAPSTQRCTVKIHNEGRAPLVVRNVTPREGTTISLVEGTEIAPGQTVLVDITFDVPAGSFDTIFGGGMIVLNDPQRPARELRVGATVKN